MPCLEQLSCPLSVRAVKAEHSPLHPLSKLLAHNQVLGQLQPWPGLKIGGYTDDLQYTGISKKGWQGGSTPRRFIECTTVCCLDSCTGWQQLAESSQGMHVRAAKSGKESHALRQHAAVRHTD